MQKPESLKAVLLASVPFLAGDPTKLAMYVDKGRIAARASRTLSFEYRYTLSLALLDYAGEVDALMVPILAWIAEQQPDLLESGDHEPFTFESEILDANTADVSIEIALTERVLVERTRAGLKVTHIGEPRTIDTFGEATGAGLWRGLLDDQVAGNTA